MFNAGVFYAPLGDASFSPLISNPNADCGERKRERKIESKREGGREEKTGKRHVNATFVRM